MAENVEFDALVEEGAEEEEEIMQDYDAMFPEEENLLDVLLSSSDEEEDRDGSETSPKGSAATGQQGVSAGHKTGETRSSPAKQVSMDSLQPIARRTRQHENFSNIPMDNLEGLLTVDEQEELGFGKVFDDEEEYQKFLEELNVERDENAAPEDSEDEDFMQELREMLEDQMDAGILDQSFNVFSAGNYTSEMPMEQISSLFRKTRRKKSSDVKKTTAHPRRSRRIDKNDKRLYAAKLAARRNYSHPNTSQHTFLKEWDTLAVLMMGDPQARSTVPLEQTFLPSEFKPGMYEDLSKQVVWRQPLPNIVRKSHSELIGRQKKDAESEPQQTISYFSEEQKVMLANHISEHLQLLVQIFLLGAMQGDENVVKESKDMLIQFVGEQGSEEPLYLKIIGTHWNRPGSTPWKPCIHEILSIVETHTFETPDAARKRKSSKALWSCLPYGLLGKLANIRRNFSPEKEPTEIHWNSRLTFCPSEDRLLAWGILKYAYDWKKIQENLLPTKTVDQLFIRKKNCVGQGKTGIIKDVVTSITMPLTPAEINVIKQALYYYGEKVTGRWEIICKNHLPYRHPKCLANLWAEHSKAKPTVPSSKDYMIRMVPKNS
ncbi:hypothetical protein M9434_004696 [Picochlorum sp. BPE23]|nr:hypothetical protein M9434_004696 [Picochlorum sp. BPE23]